MESSLIAPTRQTGPAEFSDRAFETGLSHERKRLGATHSLLINGRACRSTAGTFEDVSPANSTVLIGRFQEARTEHVGKAIAAARQAFPFWRELGWEQRVAFHRKLAELLEKHAYEFGAMLCLETGKPRRQAMAEVQDTQQLLSYQAHEMEGRQGFRIPLAGNGSMRVYNTLEPLGVWGVVSSCDAPLFTAAGMIAAATLTGNTVVFKPSSQAPFIGLRLHELFSHAGFPVGIVNFITGPGISTGQVLAAHPDLGGLAFSGTHPVGMSIRDHYRDEPQRPCLLQMSANNPVFVMPTASLEEAAAAVVDQTFLSAGQGADAWSRVYVHRDISHPFTACLVEQVESLRVGLPESPDTQMGPLTRESGVALFRRAVNRARKDGRIACGGREINKGDLEGGFFVEPTLVIDLERDSPLQRDPLPVPILTVTDIKSLEDGIELANRCPFGLVAGLHSQVDGEKQRFYDEIQAGTLLCNRRPGLPPCMPASGGWKSSSTTGKSMSGPHFLTQFLREQTRHIFW